MDLNPQTFFKNIHALNNDPEETLQQLSSLNNILVKEQLDESTLDSYLLNAFNSSYGLLKFLSNITNNKDYSKCVEKSLEIIYLLINNLPKKVKRNIPQIYDVCLNIIKSKKTSSFEKRKAYDTLTISFKKCELGIECNEQMERMYDLLYCCLSDKSTSESVLEKLLITIGTFARYNKDSVKDPVKLRRILINFAEVSAKPITTNGSFLGLLELVNSFPLEKDNDDDVPLIHRLYVVIKKNAIETSSRSHAGCRAALTFLTTYIALFDDLIVKDVSFWLCALQNWTLATNSDDSKAGHSLARAIYQSVANFVRNNENNEYHSIVKRFKDKLQLSVSSNLPIERNLAFDGLCIFSSAFKAYLTPDELNEITLIVLKLFDANNISEQEDLDNFPKYLNLTVHYLSMQPMTKTELMRLQHAVVSMMRLYPKFHPTVQVYVVGSIRSCLYRIKVSQHNYFDSFLENVVYHGVVWSCSHQHTCEAADDDEDEEPRNILTVKSYLSLWKGLVRLTGNNSEIDYNEAIEISTKLVEKLIKTLILLTNKLNVELISSEQPNDSSVSHKVAEENDFAIFLNVADFYQEVFVGINFNVFDKCLAKLITHFLKKCVKYPIISGFYKLLALSLKISRQLNYFQHWQTEIDIKSCYESLKQFLCTFFVRVEQYTDELLISALYVLLECPSILIKDMLPACEAVFLTILNTGKTYLKLVDMAVNILIEWQSEIEEKAFNAFLLKILPHFDYFLRSSSLDRCSANVMQSTRKTAALLNKRKVIVEIESDLLAIQKKILHFVGSQNFELYGPYVFNDSCIDLAVWDMKQHIKIQFAYDDMRIDFYLDKMIPKVVELALDSTDKKAKITACELLHSILMVFLGTTKQMSQSALTDLNKLFKYVASPLLKLGCDLNPCTRQLFEPLVFQLIHWYTHKLQQNEHSLIMVDAILEGITNASDSALRDFCGRCVSEYVKWLIKQRSQKQLLDDQMGIKYLTSQMRFFSLHPDLFKKLGAALIFNSIYRELREENSLLDIYWIEFLHIYVKSLSTIDLNVRSENVLSEIQSSINHLQRGFVEKSRLFNTANAKRRLPGEIEGGKLKDVAIWIFNQTKTIRFPCRKVCMELFEKIAPLSTGFETFASFLTENVSSELNEIIEGYMEVILQHSNLVEMKEMNNVESGFLIKWEQSLLCALDGYEFLLKLGLDLSECAVNAKLKSAIQCFIGLFASRTFKEVLNLVENKNWTFTVFDEQEFTLYKGNIILKIFKVLLSMFRNNAKMAQFELFYSKDLWTMIGDLIFTPHLSELGDLEKNVFESLKMLLAKIHKTELNDLIFVLKIYISAIFEKNTNVIKSLYTLKERNFFKGLLFLQNCNLNDLVLEERATITIGKVLEELPFALQSLSETTLGHISNIFQFCLFYSKSFCAFIQHGNLLQNIELNHETKLFGLYLFETFDPIAESILNKFDMFIDQLFARISESTLKLLFYILHYMEKNKQLKNVKDHVVKSLLRIWPDLEVYFNKSFSESDLGVDLIRTILILSSMQNKNDLVNVKKWLIFKLQEDLKAGEDKKDVIFFKLKVLNILVHFLDENDDVFELDLAACVFAGDIDANLKEIGIKRLIPMVSNVKSLNLLKGILHTAAILSNENLDANFNIYLKEFIVKSDESLQIKSLNLLNEMIAENCLSDVQKYNLLNTTTSLFQFCSANALEQFFAMNIVEILNNLQEPTASTNLLLKIRDFMWTEIMFFRCFQDSEEINSITQTALPESSTNKDLFKKFLIILLNVCKDPDLGADLADLLRKLKCHSYNCSVSLLCNCIKDERFFSKVFSRKDCQLWTNLIDTSKKYAFPIDFDVLPKERKRLVNIRDKNKANLNSDDEFKQKYLDTTRVYNSSLSEDFTKFDFSESAVRSQSEIDLLSSTSEESSNQTVIQLDGLDVNAHECMATVCGLVEYLCQSRQEDDAGTPDWIESIRNLLMDETSHCNEKIFWAKVVVNTSHLLQPFAKYLVEPLISFLIRNTAGESLNYFSLDIIHLLATWSSCVTLEATSECELASKFLAFLIKQLTNERRERFKYYLELIKIIIESWKGHLSVPHELIQQKLQYKDGVTNRIEPGIHLCSIFLVNNIAPWEKSYSDLNLFKMIMKCSTKFLYKQIAETIGLTLCYLEDKTEFQKALASTQKLLKLVTDAEKYANVLDAIALRFPAVIDTGMLQMLVFRFDAAPDDLKVIYLTIFLKQAHLLDGVSEFMVKDWSKYLESDKIEIQMRMLNLILDSFQVLKTSKHFERIVETCCKFADHSNQVFRGYLYDIAIKACENENEAIAKQCVDILIRGFMEKDVDLREKVRSFWQESTSLVSNDIQNRFSLILSRFYSPSVEGTFLGYNCFLLLDILRLNDTEYSKKLFEYPLEDCNFEHYNLNLSASLQTTPVVPLFAKTYGTLSEKSFGLSDTSNYSDELRQTQTYRTFERTQSDISIRSQYTSSESSLAISLDKESFFLNPNKVDLSQEYKKSKSMRFLKHRSDISKSFAKHEVSKMVMKSRKRVNLARRRDNQVTLYRKYRIGDLPDVQIGLNSLIEPLKVLALIDGEIANCVYLAIFEGISKKSETSDEFLNLIADSIKNIFNSSLDYNVHLFRALFSIVIKNRNSIRLEADLVRKISEASGLISIGAFLLEEYLINLDDYDEGPSTKRSSQANVNSEVNYWLNLAELYKSIDQWDVVKGIFLQKINSDEYAKEAILAESEKDWRTAKDLYEYLVESHNDYKTKYHYTESYLKCLESLGRWDETIESIGKTCEDQNCWPKLWDQNWKQQKLLPFYIRAQLKRFLFGSNENQLLLELNETLLSENANYLQNNFAEEMAILFVSEDNINQTEQCVNNLLKNFLYHWQLIDRSYSNYRYNNLLKLQHIVDIHKFVNVSAIDSAALLQDFLSYWRRTNVELSSAVLSETQMLYRKQFVSFLENKLAKYASEEMFGILKELKSFKMDLYKHVINTAISENNFDMAKKYLVLYKDQPDFQFYVGKVGFIKYNYLDEPEAKIKLLLNSCCEIENCLSDNLSAHISSFTYLTKLSKMLMKNSNHFESFQTQIVEQITRKNVGNGNEVGEFAAVRLKSHLAECEKQFNSIVNNVSDKAQINLIGEAYLKLTYYFNTNKENAVTNFICCVLKAIKYENAEARQLFPCILSKTLSNSDQQMFKDEIRNIPVWMFLDWIPQILISIDSANVGAVEELVLSIAELYPQAIMYAYRLSKKNYKFEKEQSKNLIGKLDKILCSDAKIDRFLHALSYVGIPYSILMYFVRKLAKMCAKKEEDEMRSLIEQISQDFFYPLRDDDIRNPIRGSIFRQIGSFKDTLNKIKTCKLEAKQSMLQKMNTTLTDKLHSMQKTKNEQLKNFSPWLANFCSEEMGLDLEIPGQYDSKRMPLTQYHIKISGFCPNVLVVRSLRKPIKLTFLGHDGKEYPYLIKFGEDLRQDQRIQQLFTLMNDILRSDGSNRGNDLCIETYKVVPLTPNLGLIQWIEDTESFSEFMCKSFKSLERDPNFERFMKFLMSKKSIKSDVEAYANAANSYDEQKVVPFYRSLVNSIPQDIMKNSFFSLSSNTEGFCALRTNFIKNYAILCGSHWLLGIGDRHLENSLVYLRTGKVLGVDFGHAFGTATQFLPIPELVPFRLTPHIVNLMEPLGEKGLFRETLIYFLRLMRSKTQCLIATMGVFIQEPSLDWLEHVARFEQAEISHTWYAELKINQAKQKLLGISSTMIMEKELSMGQQHNPALAKLIEHVVGSQGQKMRAAKHDKVLSVEDQADVLIDHATDYNLLGRMLAGWQPWV